MLGRLQDILHGSYQHRKHCQRWWGQCETKVLLLHCAPLHLTLVKRLYQTFPWPCRVKIICSVMATTVLAVAAHEAISCCPQGHRTARLDTSAALLQTPAGDCRLIPTVASARTV